MTVRPCRKCGGTDRYRSGDCKVCTQAAARRRYREHPDRRRRRVRYPIPTDENGNPSPGSCTRCGTVDRLPLKPWQIRNNEKFGTCRRCAEDAKRRYRIKKWGKLGVPLDENGNPPKGTCQKCGSTDRYPPTPGKI